MGDRRNVLSFEEIEKASAQFKTCPKCHSVRQFWVGMRRGRPYIQCKNCGTRFEPFELYRLSDGSKETEVKFLRE